MLEKLKSACSIRKTNSGQVCLQMFCKSLRTNWQIPQRHRLFMRDPDSKLDGYQWCNQSKRATWATDQQHQWHIECFINLRAGQPGQSKGQTGHCPQLPRCSYATDGFNLILTSLFLNFIPLALMPFLFIIIHKRYLLRNICVAETVKISSYTLELYTYIIIIINLTSMFFQDQSRVWTAASQQHKIDMSGVKSFFPDSPVQNQTSSNPSFDGWFLRADRMKENENWPGIVFQILKQMRRICLEGWNRRASA